MDVNCGNYNTIAIQSDHQQQEDYFEIKRGPWSFDEDMILINYISIHGEGHWNSLAHSAGLKRTGKSCRLRWLNYLCPNVRRGNLTLEEQLTILELHCRWGNRWSKIAQHLPGRTDNEIKNYWRTRVQKHAKNLRCDVNSKQFKDTLRYSWIPRLMEKIHATSSSSASPPIATHCVNINQDSANNHMLHISNIDAFVDANVDTSFSSENSSMAASSDTHASSQGVHAVQVDHSEDNNFRDQNAHVEYEECLTSPIGYFNYYGLGNQGFEERNNEDLWESFWNVEDLW